MPISAHKTSIKRTDHFPFSSDSIGHRSEYGYLFFTARTLILARYELIKKQRQNRYMNSDMREDMGAKMSSTTPPYMVLNSPFHTWEPKLGFRARPVGSVSRNMQYLF